MSVTVTRSSRLQQPVTYAFVDAGHLRPNFSSVTERWFGGAVEFDVFTIQTMFRASKVFYYDSIDDRPRANESASNLDARVREQERGLREVNAIVNTHVRYGSITGRDRKKRQKEVDILIAVDMMNHAARQNMDRAVLVTGDRDFTPLVETLVQMGLTIEIAGDFRSTSDVLREAADYYRPLALHEYSDFVEGRAKSKMPPFPLFSGDAADLALSSMSAVRLSSGPVGDKVGVVHFLQPRNCFAVELSDRNAARYVILSSREDFERLSLYFELQYGKAPWLEEFVSRVPKETSLWHRFPYVVA